ncbi:hypothetical protein ABZ484_15120 [Streptomyces sp. NPDC006393]|uniref:hypothetical protein n=1 Tax=Streptomyces sp. NPDC006393 TaxID=3156763 RepID=UPI0033E82787
MPNGFPDGKFRIVQKRSGNCLVKHCGYVPGMDTSATYEHVSAGSLDPTVTLAGKPQGGADEVWYYDAGRIVAQTEEPAHRGRFALRVMGDRLSMIGTGSIYVEKWEYTADNRIKVSESDVYLTMGADTYSDVTHLEGGDADQELTSPRTTIEEVRAHIEELRTEGFPADQLEQYEREMMNAIHPDFTRDPNLLKTLEDRTARVKACLEWTLQKA